MRNAEIKLEEIVDQLQEGVQILNSDWEYVFVNETMAACQLTDKTKLIGKSILKRYPGFEETELFQMMRKCMIERNSQKIETAFIYPDNSSKWFSLTLTPVHQGILITSVDITSRKTNELKATRLSALYALISQINQNIVRSRDEENLFFNACSMAVKFGKFQMAWIGLFDRTNGTVSLVDENGMPENDINDFFNVPVLTNDAQWEVDHTASVFVSEDIRNDPAAAAVRSFALRYGISSCIILPIKKSGRIIGSFNLYGAINGFAEEDERILLTEIARDISFALDLFEKEKKHAETEARLVKNENRFRCLIEMGSDMISMVNAFGKLTYLSPSVFNSLGYRPAELQSRSDDEFIYPDDLPGFKVCVENLIKTPGASFHRQLRLLDSKGNWIWCEGTVTNLLDQPGVHALVSNFRDISVTKALEINRQKAEDELREKNDELNKTNAELDRFVYSASHDLSAPLCSVTGLVALIEMESQEKSTLEYADKIRKSVSRLTNFIKNILRYSKNNRMKPVIRLISLRDAVQDVVDSLRHMNDAEGIDFKIEISESVSFYSDPERLTIILENLLSNAIKFQDRCKPDKFVKIQATCDTQQLRLTVEDNGIGIPDFLQPRIFDMFFRISGEREGSGIGLYIVKETVTRLGGTIAVDSTKSRGTIFLLNLKNWITHPWSVMGISRAVSRPVKEGTL